MIFVDRLIRRAIVRAATGAVVATTLAVGASSTALAAVPPTPGASGQARGHHAHCIQSGKPGRCRDARADALAAALALREAEARTLGITPAQLLQDLRSGKTLDQIAAVKGMTEDQFKRALLPNLKTTLASQVAAKHLTQAEADKFYARLANRPGVPGWNAHRKPAPKGKGRPTPAATTTTGPA